MITQDDLILQIRNYSDAGFKCVIIEDDTWRETEESHRYWVSDKGEVVSLIRAGRILKKTISNVGYYYVSLMINGNPIKTLIHRIACAAFHIGRDQTVNHRDGDKLNNNISNLEWASQEQNNNHAKDSGLNNCFSESHHNAKLKNSDIPVIRERIASGESHISIAKDYPVKRRVIDKIANGTGWRRVV